LEAIFWSKKTKGVVHSKNTIYDGKRGWWCGNENAGHGRMGWEKWAIHAYPTMRQPGEIARSKERWV